MSESIAMFPQVWTIHY